jgi:hypothetical protein
MRYIFPHFTPEPEFVQPDYRAWEAVQIGMNRGGVTDLLGQPLDDQYRGGRAKPNDPYYSYGYLQFPVSPHPRTYSFLIGFDNQGRVFTKEDPFNGRLSKNGEPTVPEIIIPFADTIFNHYPRIVDMRWYPSSGRYPMRYSVELGVGDPESDEWFSSQVIESALQLPFFMKTFQGAQPGRIRVKAHNEIGESDWSNYRCFKFVR